MPYLESAFGRPLIERLHGLREPGGLVEMAGVVAEADGHGFDMEGTSSLLEQMALDLRELPGLNGNSADCARVLSEWMKSPLYDWES